jgi:hypothetical protein
MVASAYVSIFEGDFKGIEPSRPYDELKKASKEILLVILAINLVFCIHTNTI